MRTSFLALALLPLASVAHAQSPAASTWAAPFAFEMPWDDGAPAFADASFLNTSPAGANGFIVSRGGHFVESRTGRRVRFLGINLTFDSIFPDKADAPKMAARLAKAGFNVARFHYLDASRYGRSTIWDESKPGFRHLDAAQLDRLDFFIAELYKRGIYANLNLHVARKFSPADGFPPSVSAIPFDFDKRVDYFEPRMIELQKEFARALLAHRNPYTGRAYANDPGVLCVEVTNEDSARWFDDGAGLLALPQPFSNQLQARWNGWLKRKYLSGSNLRTAWSGGSASLGAEMLADASAPAGWAREVSGGAEMEVASGDGALSVRVSKKGGAAWNAQLHQRGLSFVAGRTYTLKMRARSKGSRSLGVSIMLDRPDWRGLGLSRTVKAGPEWKEFSWVFEAPETIERAARLSLQAGDEEGEIELQGVSLRPGAVGVAPPAEALGRGEVALPRDVSGAARRDWMEFLTDLEVGYANEMRGLLRRDLGLKSMLSVSQVDYGSLTGIYREAGSDFTDKHEYWDHPSTPPSGWDITRLTFGNTSMVPSLGAGNTLSSASSWRVAGRPFAMSEYNHPFPNEFDSECVPLLALGASWQDWDAIYFHEWGFSPVNNKGAGQRISNPFTMWNAVSKMAFLPSMSILFRTSQLDRAPDLFNASVPVKREGATLSRSIQSLWSDAPPIWQARRELQAPGSPARSPFSGGGAPFPPLYKVQWSDGKGAVPASLVVDAPSAQVLAGTLGNREWSSERLKLSVGACPNSFAVVSLCALDGQPLERSPRVLLSVVSRISNRGMKLREDRKNLPDWGNGPVEVEVPAMQVEMKSSGPRRVQVLDATGKPLREVASRWEGGTLRFETSGADKSVWYGIEVR